MLINQVLVDSVLRTNYLTIILTIAYSLLGVFDVYILPLYSEGTVRALARLKEEFDKIQKCIQDLHLSDPRDNKKRIEDTKGGLLEDSYRWILGNSEFKQ
jgi:hypothetical protein